MVHPRVPDGAGIKIDMASGPRRIEETLTEKGGLPDMDLGISIQGRTLNVTRELLDRYNIPGPRYTSYPTAPEWSDDFGPADYAGALERSNDTGAGLSLYIHIPFCERLCLFCGCNVVINRNHDIAIPYLGALESEISMVADRLDRSRPVTQFHLGGGTPTYLAPAQLEELFLFVKRRFAFAPDAEIGVEVDPGVTSGEHIRMLRSLGFNRISIGIQDFNPVVQQTVRRVQPYESTREFFAECRLRGYESVNIDLIYGLPRQTAESFIGTVDQVIGLGPDRVAMFSYAHVPWLKKQQGALARLLPSGMEKFQIFRAGMERFTAAGYVYIGMDHFARPDDELCAAQRDRTLHRNFQGYTTKAGADLLGFGVSSISGVGRTYAQNNRDLKGYYAAVEQNRLPVMRGITLSDDDLLRRSVIGRLLCHCTIHKREIGEEFSICFEEYFAEELERLKALEADGLVEIKTDAIDVTMLGRIFIRNIGMVFDRYLRRQDAKPVFSKTL
ncbi:MAG TPA: oxygen-independent coproporphyrinogen III oxidase [Acidobacteriota bacterium]|nr:oxygen-independent coproporphyrinogen III oxidase [Acidobacteriota bacterium]